MISVGAVIFSGSTTGRLADMSMYVPVGTEVSSASTASAKASTTVRSLVPGWSRVKMLCTKARSIGRRLLARYSARRFLRSASVGLPSPVHTSASSARRPTRSGWRCANNPARSAPDDAPYSSSRWPAFCCRMYSEAAARSSAPQDTSAFTGRDLSERP